MFVFSHFAVFVASCHVAAITLSSRHLCTQEEFYQGYSRLVNFTEETEGGDVLWWVVASLDLMLVTLSLNKSFKSFTFEVCGKVFH